MTRIPLINLDAQWIKDRKGIAFNCPTCEREPHTLILGVADQSTWGNLPVYRMAGYTLTGLSIAPTVIGATQQLYCGFRGWIKNGFVEWIHLDRRPIRRLEYLREPEEETEK